jgi:hypothetical protein
MPRARQACRFFSFFCAILKIKVYNQAESFKDLRYMNPSHKVHVAIAVGDLSQSITEYTRLLGQEPDLVIPSEYALWRTQAMNLSIRVTDQDAGIVRHLGFEIPNAQEFSIWKDTNGITWETFNKHHQAEEIKAAWPDVDYIPR